mmetsp:Transcript_22101/g.40616  ORF Transcript_22101/g.40616 Transcript_22101/m.40616 type:complete len:143 (-) Transcript_22101:65-493(-)
MASAIGVAGSHGLGMVGNPCQSAASLYSCASMAQSVERKRRPSDKEMTPKTSRTGSNAGTPKMRATTTTTGPGRQKGCVAFLDELGMELADVVLLAPLEEAAEAEEKLKRRERKKKKAKKELETSEKPALLSTMLRWVVFCS